MPDSNQSPVTPPIQQAVQYTYLRPPIAEKEINLLDLWRVLAREKWLILIFTVFCTSLAVFVALTTIPIYRAEVMLEPVVEDEKRGGGMLAQYGGLAAMAGINISNSNGSKNSNIIILQSRTFAEEFLRDKRILPILFHKKWDSENQSWKVKDPKEIPTMLDGVEYLRSLLKVSEDKKTGMVTLAIEWHYREQTANLANLLVDRINSYLRYLVVHDAKKSMEYLEIELKETNLTELKQVITSILESQIKKIMLTKARTDFAFKVIDSAVVPPENEFIKPKRLLIIIIGFALGGTLGVFAALFRNFLKSLKKTVTKIYM